MIVSSVLFALSAQAQELPIPSLSPRAEVMQEIGVVEVRVNYARPAKRDRVIFGELVPWGEVWRTGANAATTIALSGAVTVGDSTLEAGRYAVFTEPGEDAWTVIFNADADQRGTGRYDAELDVARIEVVPAEGPKAERLTFGFADVTTDSASLELVWDGVKVALPLTVATDEMLDAAVERFVPRSSRQLASAARHYSRGGQHDRASDAADLARELQEDWYTLWTKAEVLRAAEDLRGARRWARRAQRSGERAERRGESFPKSYAERIDQAIDDWR